MGGQVILCGIFGFGLWGVKGALAMLELGWKIKEGAR
jgi:hypothetical protein